MPGYGSLVFADTHFWIAVTDPVDKHHEAAWSLRRAFSRARFVTTDYIMAELLAFYSRYGAKRRREAAQTVRDLLDSRETEVVTVDQVLFRSGLDLYEARSDKHYSQVDCASMCLMRERGILEVLTNDRHFEQEGFVPLLRD